VEWDKETALESVDGDKELLQELIQLFTDTMEGDLGEIARGKSSQDNEVIARSAHSIKGASVALGFKTIRQLAEKVEKNAKKDQNDSLEEDLLQLQDLLQEAKQAGNW